MQKFLRICLTVREGVLMRKVYHMPVVVHGLMAVEIGFAEHSLLAENLCQTVRLGDMTEVFLLIEMGANPFFKTESMTHTAFELAVELQNEQMVSLFSHYHLSNVQH